ncbi:MAG: TDP-N-acetylfucosamine:lipid II N-acetylfucosaminyltransferase [Sphingobacterium sp.]|jgi:hypothetical protein|nr:TDP-N-acetylfucosamine:lipid II N-acetylfucosaminyltransferase [Sphingobacterium sp.]
MGNNNLLHIASDEKFINLGIQLFEEAFPGRNVWRIVREDPAKELKHVSTDIKDIDFYNLNGFSTNRYLEDLREVKYVVFHNADSFKTNLILNTPSDAKYKLLWIFWGAEIYNNVYFNASDYISSATKKLLGTVGISELLGSFIKKIKRQIWKSNHPHFRTLRAIKKIDAVLGLHSDFDLLKQFNFVKSTCIHVDFSYFAIDYLFKTVNVDIKEKDNSLNILIGNSATPTNNHIDIFNLINEIQGDLKFVVPLSYGNNEYKNMILDKGYSLLKGRFHPLVDFMPISKYNQLLVDCDVAIFNHFRQQGFGNMLTLLWLGVKVFINENSSLKEELKRMRIIFYYVNDINNKTLTPLTKIEKDHNRYCVEQHYSSEKIVSSLIKSLGKK